MRPRPLLQICRLGRMRYHQALDIQEALVQKAKECRKGGGRDEANVLLLVEHDPVYTTGLRDTLYGEEEEQRLKSLGADFFRTNRGGLITFHGPGQLVVYPILDLTQFVPKESFRKALLGMKWYISSLEQTVINLSSELSLHAERSPHTGVWIRDKKVCAVGVHNSHLVTSHGIALNCNIDLDWFSHIVPCGIEGKGVTSLSNELHRNVDVSEIEPLFLRQFSQVFACDLSESDINAHVSLLEL